MKKISILLTALLLITANTSVFAKKATKAENKAQQVTIQEWKQRKHQMDPLQLKALIEENHQLKAQKKKLEEEIRGYKNEIEKAAKLQAELEELKQLQSKGTPHKPVQEASEQGEDLEDDEEDGLSINEDNLGWNQEAKRGNSQKNKNTQQHGLEKDANSLKGFLFKVQVGVYEDYWQANQLKEELRAQGKKTWIVVYKDGKRVPLKEVLAMIVKKAPKGEK